MKFGEYELKIIIVPIMGTNCYFLSRDGKALLVDAAGDGSLILDYLNNKNLKLEAVLVTHGHFDHIEALDMIHEKVPEAKIYMCDKEKVVIDNNDYSLMDHQLKDDTKGAITYLSDGTHISELGLDIELINTPGHTIGSCCYYIKGLNLMFSGDTLFRETYGRTDLPTGNMKDIALSVAVKLMKFNDDLEVYPGHGLRTIIGHERKNNELNRDYVIEWAKSV